MIDHEKVEQAVRLLLEGIGEDVNREGLIDTPDRIARMYEEIYGGMEEDAATHLSRTFTVDSSEMVVEKDITFYSTCEHHLLPFYGKVHIGYIPDGKVVGLSKLARTVEVFARRLQLQEQLTGQIADALMEHMQAKGAIVMIEAEHMCMTMRGIKKPGSQTVTLARRGVFETDPALEERIFPHVGEIAMLIGKVYRNAAPQCSLESSTLSEVLPGKMKKWSMTVNFVSPDYTPFGCSADCVY